MLAGGCEEGDYEIEIVKGIAERFFEIERKEK